MYVMKLAETHHRMDRCSEGKPFLLVATESNFTAVGSRHPRKLFNAL